MTFCVVNTEVKLGNGFVIQWLTHYIQNLKTKNIKISKPKMWEFLSCLPLIAYYHDWTCDALNIKKVTLSWWNTYMFLFLTTPTININGGRYRRHARTLAEVTKITTNHSTLKIKFRIASLEDKSGLHQTYYISTPQINSN